MKRAQSGFTLIEVMVAITVMALVSVISWRALDSITRSDERLRTAEARTGDALRVLAQLQRDVAMRADMEMLQGLPRPANVPASLMPPALGATAGSAASLQLDIVRRVDSDGEQWQRVRWWREGNTLMRAAGAAGTALPLAEPQQADAHATLEDLHALQFRAWSPGSGWKALPDTSTTLPARGLEIQLDVGSAQTRQRYRRVLPL